MRSVISTFVILALSACVVRAVSPLTGCSAGSAVLNERALTSSGVCGYGMPEGSWAPNNIAAVSEAFFLNGARCGECFEVVGPLGSVVVTVTNYCPKTSDDRCKTDKAHFILSPDAFSQIANTTYSVINDLGYRQVSCPVSGDASVVFPEVSTTYFFSILPSNTRIAVASVEVKGNSWSRYEFAVRTTNSAKFSWNKNVNALTFPVNIRFTAETGQKLVLTVNSLTANSPVSLGAQFSDVPEAVADCRMGVASPVVFISEFGLGAGWDDSYSFKLISKNIDTTDKSLHAVMGAYGAVQFTREGGFDTAYWTSVTFTARTGSPGYDKLRVYLGTETDKAVALPALTGDFATYTINFEDLQSASVQPSIVIQNNDGATVDVWLSNVALIRNTNVPADAAPISTTGLVTYTTTAAPPGTGVPSSPGVEDSESGPNGNGNSNGAASTTVSVTVALLVLVIACLV